LSGFAGPIAIQGYFPCCSGGRADAANTTLARRFVDEVINAHDLDAALTELVAEDVVEQNLA
jgi:1,6-anhydro-N-acetylmuramate kinase